MPDLLAGVNAVLQKVESLDSDGALVSLTDTARQSWIDNAVAALNETVDRLYALPNTPDLPQQLAENTITLVTGDQDYALQTDLVRLLPKFGFINEANNHIINIMADHDGYRRLILVDLDQDDTGLPSLCAIRPTDGQIWMNRNPTAGDGGNGRVYKYRYEKDLGMSLAADTFPFTDPVYRAVILAAAELYQRINFRTFDERFFNASLAQAAGRLSQIPPRDSWAEQASQNPTDPMESGSAGPFF